MSIRSAERRIAKARMAALGIDRINRKMGKKKDKTDKNELPLWRQVLTGKYAAEAERALCPKQIRNRTRKIRKVKG